MQSFLLQLVNVTRCFNPYYFSLNLPLKFDSWSNSWSKDAQKNLNRNCLPHSGIWLSFFNDVVDAMYSRFVSNHSACIFQIYTNFQ